MIAKMHSVFCFHQLQQYSPHPNAAHHTLHLQSCNCNAVNGLSRPRQLLPLNLELELGVSAPEDAGELEMLIQGGDGVFAVASSEGNSSFDLAAPSPRFNFFLGVSNHNGIGTAGGFFFSTLAKMYIKVGPMLFMCHPKPFMCRMSFGFKTSSLSKQGMHDQG